MNKQTRKKAKEDSPPRLLKVTLEWENEVEEFAPSEGDYFLVVVKPRPCGQLLVRSRWMGGRRLWTQVFLAFGQMHDRLLKLEDQKAVSDYVEGWVEDVLGGEG